MKRNSRAIEMANRLNFINIAYQVGYGSYLPVIDEGIDLIIYREKPKDLRKVQLKGRWTVAKKYIGRDIWIAFPYEDHWYLAPHDDMLAAAKKMGFLRKSKAWNKKSGEHNRASLNDELLESMRPHRFPEPTVSGADGL